MCLSPKMSTPPSLWIEISWSEFEESKNLLLFLFFTCTTKHACMHFQFCQCHQGMEWTSLTSVVDGALLPSSWLPGAFYDPWCMGTFLSYIDSSNFELWPIVFAQVPRQQSQSSVQLKPAERIYRGAGQEERTHQPQCHHWRCCKGLIDTPVVSIYSQIPKKNSNELDSG